MSRIVRLVALFALSLLFADVAAAEILRSDEGGFTVDMPGQPKYSTDRRTTESGIKYRADQWLLERGDKAWLITWMDYDTDISTDYERAAQTAVQSYNASLVSKKFVSIGPHRAMELLLDAAAERLMVRTRILFVGRSLYQVVYGGPRGTETDPAVEAFLTSFNVAR